METQSEKYEGWAILELMGHRRIGGYVREVTMFGAPMARIDIPCEPPATQFYGGSAVFCMTPTTEAIARAAAKTSVPAPVQHWELPQLAPAPPPAAQDDDGDDQLGFDDDGFENGRGAR